MNLNKLCLYINSVNGRTGRAHPVSNQIVTCGVITHDYHKALETMRRKGAVLKRASLNHMEWELHNERWVWRLWNDGCRGYRFYKALVDPGIDDDLFEFLIIKSSRYCCSAEVIWED